MPKILPLLSFFILSPFLLSATGKGVKDTVRLDEIVVTGSMPRVNLRNVPMSISIVSEKQIENRFQSSLLPLLTEEVPGFFITQRGAMGYGVAAGAAGGMSIRGIGGTPTTGVLVLIDGHPQYMGLMGHPLADSYQSMMTERVEVVRGPASMLYGSNAMGGVINIITKESRKDGFRSAGELIHGSHHTYNAEASADLRHERVHANMNLGYNRSDGHRENMDFSQLNGYAKLGYDFSPHWTTFADLNLSKTKSSNPGSVDAPMLDNDADVLRGMVSAAIENDYGRTSGAVKLFYNFGSHQIDEGYRPEAQPKTYLFHSNDQMTGVSVHQSYSLHRGNNTTAGFDFQRFGGKAWNKFKDQTDNAELANVHLTEIAGYINMQQTLLQNKLTLNAGVRLDHHEQTGSEWIPQLGLSFTPSAATTMKAVVSKGFRNPTIREMYMFPPQNPDLRPERLMNYEISWLQSLIDNKMSLGVNLFYIDGDNLIQTLPVDGKPQNVNTGKVENKGLEITAAYRITPQLQVSGNYSFLDMTYKIVAAPEHKLYVGASYALHRWMVATGVQHIGNLYTAVTPDLTKNSFTLWNARASYKANNWLEIFARGENLLGQSYEINKGFPMPSATVFGGVKVKI